MERLLQFAAGAALAVLLLRQGDTLPALAGLGSLLACLTARWPAHRPWWSTSLTTVILLATNLVVVWLAGSGRGTLAALVLSLLTLATVRSDAFRLLLACSSVPLTALSMGSSATQALLWSLTAWPMAAALHPGRSWSWILPLGWGPLLLIGHRLGSDPPWSWSGLATGLLHPLLLAQGAVAVLGSLPALAGSGRKAWTITWTGLGLIACPWCLAHAAGPWPAGIPWPITLLVILGLGLGIHGTFLLLWHCQQGLRLWSWMSCCATLGLGLAAYRMMQASEAGLDPAWIGRLQLQALLHAGAGLLLAIPLALAAWHACRLGRLQVVEPHLRLQGPGTTTGWPTLPTGLQATMTWVRTHGTRPFTTHNLIRGLLLYPIIPLFPQLDWAGAIPCLVLLGLIISRRSDLGLAFRGPLLAAAGAGWAWLAQADPPLVLASAILAVAAGWPALRFPGFDPTAGLASAGLLVGAFLCCLSHPPDRLAWAAAAAVGVFLSTLRGQSGGRWLLLAGGLALLGPILLTSIRHEDPYATDMAPSDGSFLGLSSILTMVPGATATLILLQGPPDAAAPRPWLQRLGCLVCLGLSLIWILQLHPTTVLALATWIVLLALLGASLLHHHRTPPPSQPAGCSILSSSLAFGPLLAAFGLVTLASLLSTAGHHLSHLPGPQHLPGVLASLVVQMHSSLLAIPLAMAVLTIATFLAHPRRPST